MLPFFKLLFMDLSVCLHCTCFNMEILENEAETSCILEFHIFYQVQALLKMSLSNFHSLQQLGKY